MNRLVCILLSLALVASIVFAGCSAQEEGATPNEAVVVAYAAQGGLFDASFVHTAEVTISEEDLQTLQDHPQDQTAYAVEISIDGAPSQNAMLSVKERTTLSRVASSYTGRFSYMIDFTADGEGAPFQELDGFSLNDVISDATYMKEYLSYRIMREAGVNAPLASYAALTINGEEAGLYVAEENVGDSFLTRTNGSSEGALYQPDSGNTILSLAQRAQDEETQQPTEPVQFPTDENGEPVPPENAQFPTDENGDPVPPEGGQIPTDENGGPIPPGMQPPMGGPGMMSDSVGEKTIEVQLQDPTEVAANPQTPISMIPPLSDESAAGADLVYIDDNPESYKAIFDHEESGVTDEDRTALIAAIKALCDGKDVDKSWNIDQIIRFFVAHNFVLNYDSYTGTTLRNYYLYQKDGAVTVFPLNYNLAFCGFQAGADTTEELNKAIDTPLNGATVEERPLWNVIFSNEEYLKTYHEYYDKLLTSFFESGKCEEEIARVAEMIKPYMEEKDSEDEESMDFDDAIEAMTLFCQIRAQSIRKQLSGELGSTSGSQTHDDMVEASGVNIAAMGVFGDFMNAGPASPQGPAGPGAGAFSPPLMTENPTE